MWPRGEAWPFKALREAAKAKKKAVLLKTVPEEVLDVPSGDLLHSGRPSL